MAISQFDILIQISSRFPLLVVKTALQQATVVMSGTDIRALLELLGDKTVSMAMRYTHLAPAHLHDAVERMAVNFPKPTDTTIAPEPECRAGESDKSFIIN